MTKGGFEENNNLCYVAIVILLAHKNLKDRTLNAFGV